VKGAASWTVSRPADPDEREADRVAARVNDRAAATQARKRQGGFDFTRVRVHDDTRAAQSARSLDAAAYTVGDHIVFNSGRYAPGSVEGRQLLAHELVHVVQDGGDGQRVRRFGLESLGPSSEKRQATSDLWASLKEVPSHAEEILLGEVWDAIKEHWIKFTAVTVALIGSEIVVGILTGTPEPTLLTKVVALALQALVLAITGYFAAVETLGAIEEAGQWLSLVKSAHGDAKVISDASRAFLRMIRHIVLAILAIIGVRAKIRGISAGLKSFDSDVSAADASAAAPNASPAEALAAPEAEPPAPKVRTAVPKHAPAASRASGSGMSGGGPLRLINGEGVGRSAPRGAGATVARGGPVTQGALALKPQPVEVAQPASAPPKLYAVPEPAPAVEPAPVVEPAVPAPGQVEVPSPKAPSPTAPAKALTPSEAAKIGVKAAVNALPTSTAVGTAAAIQDEPSERRRRYPDVRLELPSQKAIHSPIYAAHIRDRNLVHTIRYTREINAQADTWRKALRPNGQYGMDPRTWDLLGRRGIDEDRRTIPNWSWSSPFISMTVDHVLELQVVPLGEEEIWDRPNNYELLDQSSNSSSGPKLKSNIRKERERLTRVTGDQGWMYDDLCFTRLIATPGPSGQRWSVDAIRSGDHLSALRYHLKERAY